MCIRIGLIELPEPIIPNDYIRPIRLPHECINVEAGDGVFAIGNGRTEFYGSPSDRRLRHGFSQVLPFAKCVDGMIFPPHPESVICAKAIQRKNVYKGDSGGPLFRSSDGALIGITSFSSMLVFGSNNYTMVEFQVFVNIAYFNDWIAMKTRMKLPNCNGNSL